MIDFNNLYNMLYNKLLCYIMPVSKQKFYLLRSPVKLTTCILSQSRPCTPKGFP